MCALAVETLPIARVDSFYEAVAPPARQREVDLSVLIPVYNGVDHLSRFYTLLITVLVRLRCTYEVLFVDDGSRDGSFDVLCALHNQDANVRVIRFRRSFGEAAALVAGFDDCRGRVIITMNANLQDDPAAIPGLLAKLEEGYDLVLGLNSPNQQRWLRALPLWLFRKVVSSTTGMQQYDFNGAFMAYRSAVTEEIKLYSDLHRFVPVIAGLRGFRLAEVTVEPNPTFSRVLGYGARHYFRAVLDLIKVLFLTRYIQKPLHLLGSLGVLMGLLGLATSLYLAEEHFRIGNTGTRPLLDMSVLLLITGVQLFSLGLLGEMLRHVSYRRTEEYSVRQRLG